MFGTNDPRKALVGSAKQVKMGPRTHTKLGEDWQEALWDIYENLGPVHYGMNFKRSAAQRVTYYVAELPEDDTDEPIVSDNEAAIDALNRLGDVGQIVGEFVVQENVAGEGWLVGVERGEGEDKTETWEVLSTGELNDRRKPGIKEGGITEGDFVLRIWRPNPRKHAKPDSPLRSVQAQCEQLLLLNDQIGATAMSRLPAGLLLIPDGLSFSGSAEEGPETGANAGGNPFQQELIEMMTTAIKNADSAARVAPAMIQGDAEMLKEIRLIDFGRDMDKTFAAMRDELLRQIANGIDLPAEILTGLADLNHWSLWGIDESTAKHHVDPDVLLVLSGLTTGYLRATLELPVSEGGAGMSKEETSRLLIWRDYTDLTSRPLTLEQAERMFDKSVITADQLKQIANIAQVEETISAGDIAVRAEAVGILFRAGFEPSAILDALELPQIAHTGVAPVTVQSEDAVDDLPNEPAGPGNTDQGPPTTAAQGIALDRFADIDQTLAAQIIEASEAAFTRAMERAGAKVRAKVRKDRQLTAMIDGVANSQVTLMLGAKHLERFQLTPDQLIPGDTFAALEARINKLLKEAETKVQAELSSFVEPDFNVTEVEADRKTGISAFIAALFAAATARLFNTAPTLDPAETGEISDSITTGQMVFDLLTTAGGGGVVTEFTTDTPRGFALGQRVRAALRDGGYLTESSTWRYGTAPRATFHPHAALNGTEVIDHESPKLAVSSEYSWLGVSHYFPGDHKGCLCTLVPTVVAPDGVE